MFPAYRSLILSQRFSSWLTTHSQIACPSHGPLRATASIPYRRASISRMVSFGNFPESVKACSAVLVTDIVAPLFPDLSLVSQSSHDCRLALQVGIGELGGQSGGLQGL